MCPSIGYKAILGYQAIFVSLKKVLLVVLKKKNVHKVPFNLRYNTNQRLGGRGVGVLSFTIIKELNFFTAEWLQNVGCCCISGRSCSGFCVSVVPGRLEEKGCAGLVAVQTRSRRQSLFLKSFQSKQRQGQRKYYYPHKGVYLPVTTI